MSKIALVLQSFKLDAPVAIVLLTIWLVCARLRRNAFRTKRAPPQVPLLELLGSPGSAKSTLARRLGRLVTGERDFEVTAVPPREEDFWLCVSETGVLALDNVNEAPRYLSSALAQAVTGTTSKKRTHYSNTELTKVTSRATIIITAVHAPLLRAETMDRMLILRLAALASYRSNDDLEREFRAHEKDAAREIDRLCRVVELRLPTASPTASHRLADFERIGRVVADELGEGPALTAALAGMSDERIKVLCDADPCFAALWEIANDPASTGRQYTLEELLDEICKRLGHRADFQTVLRDPQRLGIWLGDVRGRAAGLLRVERHRSNRGVRYSIEPGR